MAVFPELLSVDVVDSSSLDCAIGSDSKSKLHCRLGAGIVISIGTEQFGLLKALVFVDLVQIVIGIHNLLHPCADSFVPIVVKVQETNLNGAPKVIRHRKVTLKKLFHRNIHCKEKTG